MDEKIVQVIENITNKDFTIYFFAIDSNGQPNAGVANIYKQAKHLQDLGFKTTILVEKEEQKDAGAWIGKDYLGLPHSKAEGLNIKSEDIIVIPELYSSIMESTKSFPCKKVVMLQNYEFALEVLELGVSWLKDYNYTDVIVTNENMAEFAKDHFHGINVHVVPLVIDPIYESKEKLRKPTVLVGGRDANKVLRMLKSFYLKSPLYSWITFKQISGMLPHELMDEMNTSAVLVWVDETASFGTLPLEAMSCGLPVVGVVPNMVPEWLTEDNGIWVSNYMEVPAALESFLNEWVEYTQAVSELSNFKEIKNEYTVEKQKEKLTIAFEKLMLDKKEEIEKFYGKEEK